MELDTFHTIATEISLLTDTPLETIGVDTELRDVGMDSLQALQLLVALEKNLQIKLQEEDLQRFTSVGSILNLIESHREASAHG